MYQPFETFQLNGRFISVIGSGGKTSFLRYLSGRLDGTVILTTSTHICPLPGIPLVDTAAAGTSAPDTGFMDPSENRARILHKIRSALENSRVICLGQLLASGKLASPSAAIPFEMLPGEADYVLVEADGARGLPLKAHRPWEPVIPACTSMTVCMVGASGIGKPAGLSCHCPELFTAMAGITPGQAVSEEHIADVLNQEDLADYYLINQTDTLQEPECARRLCNLVRKSTGICSLKELLSQMKVCSRS